MGTDYNWTIYLNFFRVAVGWLCCSCSVPAETAHAWAQTCVHYAGQLCQCAWCALFSAASCSSVPRRLPASGGSLETSFQAAHCGADHAAQLLLVRPQDHVEQMLVGHHVLEPLSLLLVGLFVELLVDWHASVYRLVDVDALWRLL